eukprot:4240704-Alexandrium_andersonii.AAC.1
MPGRYLMTLTDFLRALFGAGCRVPSEARLGIVRGRGTTEAETLQLIWNLQHRTLPGRHAHRSIPSTLSTPRSIDALTPSQR